MKKNKNLSILIPTYNRPKMLMECLNSIINNIDFEYEIIISDNSNNDNTKNAIKNFKERNHNVSIIYKKNKKNIGMVSNWFQSISLAKSEFLNIISDDDLIYDGNVYKKAIENLNNEDLNYFISNSVLMKNNNYNEIKYRSKISTYTPLDIIKAWNYGRLNIYPCSVIARTKTLKQNIDDYNLKNQKINLCIDTFIFYPSFCKEKYILFSESPLCIYRVHESIGKTTNFYKWVEDYKNLKNLLTSIVDRKFTNEIANCFNHLICFSEFVNFYKTGKSNLTSIYDFKHIVMYLFYRFFLKLNDKKHF